MGLSGDFEGFWFRFRLRGIRSRARAIVEREPYLLVWVVL